MYSKTYYPYIDLLKFVCCIGVVAIHTRPLHYSPIWIGMYLESFLAMMVPIFFIVSAFLLSQKLSFKTGDEQILCGFISRLFLLYVLWTILMLWEWLPGFIKHCNDDWGVQLVFEFVLRGAPHGSWFILSLIYGVLVVYVLNRCLGQYFSTFVCFLVVAYIRLIENDMIPDVVHLESLNPIINITNSPLISIFSIQLGFLLNRNNGLSILRNIVGKLSGGVK